MCVRKISEIPSKCQQVNVRFTVRTSSLISTDTTSTSDRRQTPTARHLLARIVIIYNSIWLRMIVSHCTFRWSTICSLSIPHQAKSHQHQPTDRPTIAIMNTVKNIIGPLIRSLWPTFNKPHQLLDKASKCYRKVKLLYPSISVIEKVCIGFVEYYIGNLQRPSNNNTQDLNNAQHRSDLVENQSPFVARSEGLSVLVRRHNELQLATSETSRARTRSTFQTPHTRKFSVVGRQDKGLVLAQDMPKRMMTRSERKLVELLENIKI